MGFEDHADRAARVATRLLGTKLPVVFTPAGGEPFEIRAVFDRSFIDVEPETSRPITSTQPVVGVRLGDFTDPPAQGDRISVGDQSFEVAKVELDGLAAADLFLHEVTA